MRQGGEGITIGIVAGEASGDALGAELVRAVRARIPAARFADRLLALFPFEPPLYAAAGLPVTFVGHPLAAEAATATSRRETREILKLDAREPAFALLPGSRVSELEMHSELLLAAAAEILEAQPEAKFLVPLVSRETRE